MSHLNRVRGRRHTISWPKYTYNPFSTWLGSKQTSTHDFLWIVIPSSYLHVMDTDEKVLSGCRGGMSSISSESSLPWDMRKKTICYFEPVRSSWKELEGGFCDTTRINIPMAIELWCLKWTLLLSSAAATGHLFGLTERISSAASGECCGDDDDGTITKKTKETEHLFSIEDEEGASSDQYLFFQRIILAILHLLTCTKDVLFCCCSLPTHSLTTPDIVFRRSASACFSYFPSSKSHRLYI